MLDHDVLRLALRLMKALDTPRSLSIHMLVEAGEWDQLVSMRVDPALYEPLYHHGVEKYRRDVFASEFLRKYEALPTSIDKAGVARESFFETERQCFATNRRLAVHGDYPVLETALEQRAHDLFGVAKHWIGNTLGPLPEKLDGRFGPGATFESDEWRSANGITAFTKLRRTPTRTSGLPEALVDHLVWQTAFGTAWGMCCPNRLIPTSRGSRFSTVPKDSSKDRGIAIEPGVNVLGQLAVGRVIRNRLKRRGIDLNNGQDLHRRMAAEASVSGDYVTIDLSNASNTVATGLVKLLLPDLWHDLLSSLRCVNTRISPTGKRRDTRWQRLEMFSSMGNGYTFELETLIFSALIHACGGEIGFDSFVYGDDIIVPVSIHADVLALLRYSGFTPNARKTFTSGYFRESCGGDFLNGHDVRPYYLKEVPHESTCWLTIANSLWDWSIKWSIPELTAVRASCLDLIPATIRNLRGPQALGHVLVWDSPERWSCRVRHGIRWFKVWRPVFRKQFLSIVPRSLRSTPLFRGDRPTLRGGVRFGTIREYWVALAAVVLGLPSDGLTPRGDLGVDGYRFGRVAYS